jgi:hypothetical protein
MGIEAVAVQCEGTLILHSDGSAAACSEELQGRPCTGPHAAHQGGTARCEEFLGAGGCEQCALDSWDERAWRHATHLGGFARTQRRCGLHRILTAPASAHGRWH